MCLSKSSYVSVYYCYAKRDTALFIWPYLLFPRKPSSGMMLIIFSISIIKKKLSEDENEKSVSINSHQHISLWYSEKCPKLTWRIRALWHAILDLPLSIVIYVSSCMRYICSGFIWMGLDLSFYMQSTVPQIFSSWDRHIILDHIFNGWIG